MGQIIFKSIFMQREAGEQRTAENTGSNPASFDENICFSDLPVKTNSPPHFRSLSEKMSSLAQ